MFRLIFILFNFQCIGQAYKPLLDNTNQWHFTTCYSGCLTDVYYTNGDTIVNGLNHKILDGYHYNSRTLLLREDLLSKKVYLTKINGSTFTEYLLYNFSLNEGATFNMSNPVSPFSLNGGAFVLDSIRMKPILNTINYKHFYFSPTANNTVSTNKVVWIEGIGSKSLINAPGGYANINGVGHLSCYFKNQDFVYSNLDSISGCSYQVLNTNQFKNSFEINLYEFDKNKFKLKCSQLISYFEIIDVMGKKIKMDFCKIPLDTIEIDLSEYSNNIYFLNVYNQSFRRKSFKIILK